VSQLLYASDGRLLDGERELVGFDASQGPFGSLTLTSTGSQYEIARQKQHGWHMTLQDRGTGQQAFEFVPHPIGRGGHLRSGDETVELKGRPLGPSHWSFESADGAQIDATAHRDEESGPWPFGKLEVMLEGGEMVGAPAIAPLTLAFGCWLIVQWETDIPRYPARGSF